MASYNLGGNTGFWPGFIGYGGALTIQTWLIVNVASGTFGPLFGISDGGFSSRGYVLMGRGSPGSGQWGALLPGSATPSAGETLTQGTQYHLLMVYDGAGTISFYRGGTFITSAGGTPFAPNSSDRLFCGGQVGTYADCAIWPAALSTREISELASGVRASNIRRASLRAYYPCNENGGGIHFEQSGFGVHLVGGQRIAADPPQLTYLSTSPIKQTFQPGVSLCSA